MRRLLHAAIAAATISSAGALKAQEPRPKGSAVESKEEVPQLKWAPKIVRESKGLTPHRESLFADKYRSLLGRMMGAHLRNSTTKTEKIFDQYKEFCDDFALFCNQFARLNPHVEYDKTFSLEMYARISAINTAVNAQIAPKSDLELYGVKDKWMMPSNAGDCEDYVFLKMLRLVEAGISPADLHLLVVHDERKQGHAVLGVDVWVGNVRNTIILDNKIAEIITIFEMEQKYSPFYASFVTKDEDNSHRVRFFPYQSTQVTFNPN